eukprot:c12576_g1_i1 orf=1-240(-)
MTPLCMYRLDCVKPICSYIIVSTKEAHKDPMANYIFSPFSFNQSMKGLFTSALPNGTSLLPVRTEYEKRHFCIYCKNHLL